MESSISSFNILQCLGSSIQDLKAQTAFVKVFKESKTNKTITKPCEFNEIVTKTGHPKGTFHNCKEKGISAFTPEGSDIIDFITLYNESVETFSRCPFKIPFGLTFDHKNQDVVRRFGDSKEKGGGSIPIWVNYEHLGLQFSFQNKDWSDAQNPITHIMIFGSKKL